jgi:hypothetical protein
MKSKPSNQKSYFSTSSLAALAGFSLLVMVGLNLAFFGIPAATLGVGVLAGVGLSLLVGGILGRELSSGLESRENRRYFESSVEKARTRLHEQTKGMTPEQELEFIEKKHLENQTELEKILKNGKKTPNAATVKSDAGKDKLWQVGLVAERIGDEVGGDVLV